MRKVGEENVDAWESLSSSVSHANAGGSEKLNMESNPVNAGKTHSNNANSKDISRSGRQFGKLATMARHNRRKSAELSQFRHAQITPAMLLEHRILHGRKTLR